MQNGGILYKQGAGKLLVPALLIFLMFILGASLVYAGPVLDIAGYLDLSYGATVKSEPTGEKPESKLWWNDGFWWGSLYNSAAGEYRIYRLDWNTQSWLDTGVALDDREESRADVLWDQANNYLYVASHFKIENSGPIADINKHGRLYRYSYSPATRSYSLNANFPVTVNGDRTETLVLDKDSTGRLWVTYVSQPSSANTDYKVYLNATTGDDLTWGTPFTLSLTQTSVTSDDIASLIAFTDDDGSKIGVMWSNGLDGKFYFATHDDNSAPQIGWTLETELAVPYLADDHINLARTSTGQVLAAIKTGSLVPTDPAIGVIARDTDGSFSFHPISPVNGMDTRPIVVVHDDLNRAYVFVSSKTGGGRICEYVAEIPLSISSMSFQFQNCPDSGTKGAKIVIGDNITYHKIHNATSTKQAVNNDVGLVVVASDSVNGNIYAHTGIKYFTIKKRVFLPLMLKAGH